MGTATKAGGKTHRFKAEVKQLLDIVVHSLYKDKDIFVRELISNAADALEKMRHTSLTEKTENSDDVELEIHITLDKENRLFTISDTGIGMTGKEAATNLGTIAHSGSREFIKQIAEGNTDTNLIGQFGVGFYSAFMVGDDVIVKTQSFQPEEAGVIWSSKGSGSYTVTDVEGLSRGTSIEVHLNEDMAEYAEVDRIKHLIKQYSSFVPFPIFVEEEQVNTVQAIWARSRSEITEEEYNEFYKFINFAGQDPYSYLHFTSDIPLGLKAILYFPNENVEKMGFGRMEPSVSLYCKKVMIQSNMEELLPEYFRFVKGVVDSEDIPLNISRETMQDSALIAKIKKVLTTRLIKHLSEVAGEDEDAYTKWFGDFGMFLKEGVYSDYEYRNKLAGLLRFDSSTMTDGKLTSLDGYIERMGEEQKEIYFISGASRSLIEAGPYLEAFAKKDVEILYLYEGIDDLVMTSLREYEEKKLVSADSADLNLPGEDKEDEDKSDDETKKESADLALWMKEVLGEKINEVRVSKRLVSSPAVLVNPDDMMTTTMQKIMQSTSKAELNLGSYILEVNADHAILETLEKLRADESQKEFAEESVWLLYDSALVSAGLIVDPTDLVERTTSVLERALKSAIK